MPPATPSIWPRLNELAAQSKQVAFGKAPKQLERQPSSRLNAGESLHTPASPRLRDLPADLQLFFSQHTSLRLGHKQQRSLYILPLANWRRSNHAVLGETLEGDRSHHWWTLAQDDMGECISIDLSPEYQGRCIDSFHELHGVAGSSPVLARSFSALTALCLDSLALPGEWGPMWLRDGFAPLGDAYD